MIEFTIIIYFGILAVVSNEMILFLFCFYKKDFMTIIIEVMHILQVLSHMDVKIVIGIINLNDTMMIDTAMDHIMTGMMIINIT